MSVYQDLFSCHNKKIIGDVESVAAARDGGGSRRRSGGCESRAPPPRSPQHSPCSLPCSQPRHRHHRSTTPSLTPTKPPRTERSVDLSIKVFHSFWNLVTSQLCNPNGFDREFLPIFYYRRVWITHTSLLKY